VKYAVEMTSDGMTYIPIFMKYSTGFYKLLQGMHTRTDRETDRQQGYLISLHLSLRTSKLL
jgi:hypothetical protein